MKRGTSRLAFTLLGVMTLAVIVSFGAGAAGAKGPKPKDHPAALGVQPRQGRKDPARHLPAVRQRPLLPRQPERPVGSRADAESARLPEAERDAAHERPHRPDLPHGRRDSGLADGALPEPARSGRVELVWVLQAGRLGRVLVELQVLDRPDRRREPCDRPADSGRRHELQHGQQRRRVTRRHRRGAQRTGTVGAVHARRLRRRQRRHGQRRPREQQCCRLPKRSHHARRERDRGSDEHQGRQRQRLRRPARR